MRDLLVQCVPSVVLLKTMSLALQPLSKLQSDQEMNTRPPPSTVAEGRPALRRPPSSPRLGACAICCAAVQLWPPLVEVKLETPPLKSAKGTTTVPLSITSGLPLMPKSLPWVVLGEPQVWPPSVEVLM